MSGKLWMLTPAVAFATAAVLALAPQAVQQTAARDTSHCVKFAAADTGVMSDATDACVFSVMKAAAEPACSRAKSRRAMVSEGQVLSATFVRTRLEEEMSLSWPLDFIVMTAGAAAGVWETTIGLIGDFYDFAERNASGLSI